MLKPPFPGKTFKHLLLASLLLTLSPWMNGRCLAKTLSAVIVATRDNGPYRTCTNGITRELEAIFPKTRIKNFSLAADSPLEISRGIKNIEPGIVFGVGTRASLFLDKLTVRAPVVFTFVIDNTLKILQKKTFAAVSLDVPIDKKMDILCRIFKRPKTGMLSATVNDEKIWDIHLPNCKEDTRILVMPFMHTVIELALKKMANSGINSFLITPDPTIYKNQEVVKYTLLWGFLNRIAICGLSRGYVKNGALFALEADIEELGKQTARLGKLLFEGKLKGKRHIEHPRKLILSINLKTAKHLGIKIPRSLINEANFIVK